MAIDVVKLLSLQLCCCPKTLIFLFRSLLSIFINIKLIEHTTQTQINGREFCEWREIKKSTITQHFRIYKIVRVEENVRETHEKKVRIRARELNDRPTQAKISFVYNVEKKAFFGKHIFLISFVLCFFLGER